MSAEYTFIPWLRRGVAAEIAEPDRLGAFPDQGPAGRATVPVELELEYVPVGGGTAPSRPVVHRDISILGPADVESVMAEAILRTVPADRALGATPGELACVEFYEEDFPWRYTPARAAGSRLRPWLALLVLTEDEFAPLRERQGKLPVLTPTPTAVLPPRTETWAWAHAQISNRVTTPGGVDSAIAAAPDHALSRLLCPRRLEPSTLYHAFLVPAFEGGRLAGLGRDATATPVQKPAWGTPAHAADRDLPVYHRFTFQTGEAGSFETLVRKLVAGPVGEGFGKRPLDVSAPGFGLDEREGATVGLEGALAPLDMARDPYDDEGEVATQLLEILDTGAQDDGDEDPIVSPPAYARPHAGLARLAQAAGDSAWLAELNLDLRNRAAAGLGAEVVRERQEELMQRAWEQVGRVEEANQRLREAELARAAAEAVYRKHVTAAGDADRVLVLTAAAQPGLKVAGTSTATVRGAIDASAVPVAAQAPAFRRITRPERPLMRRLPGETGVIEFQGGLLRAMNAAPESALSAAPPADPPAASVALATVTAAVNDSVSELQGERNRPDLVFLEMTNLFLRQRRQASAGEDFGAPAFLAVLKSTLTGRVAQRLPGNDAGTLDRARRVRDLIAAITGAANDGPEGAIVTVSAVAFTREFGAEILAKALEAVTIRSSAAPPGTQPARSTSLLSVTDYRNALNNFVALDNQPAPPAPPLLSAQNAPASLQSHVLGRLAPAKALGDRVARVVPAVAGRPADAPGRFAPVMAHPEFRDPMFESLRALSQDYIIPNASDLPRDSITLMEPNPRFIEAYMAGLNHAFAQELLWREYPTDQRGTCFKAFWDTRDALEHPDRDEIDDISEWAGDLGAQAGGAASVLVLVIRGELLERFPSTVIFAQQAKWTDAQPHKTPRTLDPAGQIRHPIFHGRLAPDITIVGFDLPELIARGDVTKNEPGWFFALMERPGEPRFGLDDDSRPLASWDDLAWSHLDGEPQQVLIEANEDLAPSAAHTAQWGATSADMASILFQSPVLYARHASEMLP